MSDPRNLFDNLCHRLNLTPDSRGEAHIDCPHCGKEAKRGQVHFSFSENGGHCFVCGWDCSMQALWGVLMGESQPDPSLQSTKKYPGQRYDIKEHEPDNLLNRYRNWPTLEADWLNYAPALYPRMIEVYGLGVGYFPDFSSKCRHKRLMVPLICRGHVIGFRGRAISCDCGKWLSPGGSRMALYNGGRLVAKNSDPDDLLGDATNAFRREGSLWIVENPIDALLLEQRGLRAVATLGVSIWRDRWTAILRTSGFQNVIVAFDNDASGNGGGQRGINAWHEDHPNAEPPLCGIKLVNKLNAAGIKAFLYPWNDAPLGTDIGDLLRKT